MRQFMLRENYSLSSSMLCIQRYAFAYVLLLGAAFIVGPAPSRTSRVHHVTYHALAIASDEEVRLIIVSVGHKNLPGQDYSIGVRVVDDLGDRILRNRWHARGRNRWYLWLEWTCFSVLAACCMAGEAIAMVEVALPGIVTHVAQVVVHSCLFGAAVFVVPQLPSMVFAWTASMDAAAGAALSLVLVLLEFDRIVDWRMEVEDLGPILRSSGYDQGVERIPRVSAAWVDMAGCFAALVLWVVYDFDSSLGFPGEGPPELISGMPTLLDVTPCRTSARRRKYLDALARTSGDLSDVEAPLTPENESQSVWESLRMVPVEVDFCQVCPVAPISPPRMEQAGSAAGGSPTGSPVLSGQAALHAADASLLPSSPGRRICGKRKETLSEPTIVWSTSKRLRSKTCSPLVPKRPDKYCQMDDCVFNRQVPGQPASKAENVDFCVWCRLRYKAGCFGKTNPL